MNYDELEARVIDSIDSDKLSGTKFAMTENITPSKQLIGLGIGGGLSGLVSGAFEKFIPVTIPSTFGIDGIIPMVAGTVIKVLVKPKGMIEDITNGLIVAGISQAVSGFTGDKMSQERIEPENTHIQSGVIY